MLKLLPLCLLFASVPVQAAPVQRAPGLQLDGATPMDRALASADTVGPIAGLSRHDADHVWFSRLHPLEGGAGIAIWDSWVGDTPVLDGQLKVLFGADGTVHAWTAGDALTAGLAAGVTGPAPQIDLRDGVALAAREVFGATPTALSAATPRHDGWWSVPQDAPTGLDLTRPGRIRPVIVAEGGLRHALEVEVWAEPDGYTEAWRVVLDANDGTVLQTEPLTRSHSFRVFADPNDHRPRDNPYEDITPHPTSLPDGFVPAYVDADLITENGFNTFGDPWLANNATDSRGNNATAYADLRSGDGYNNGDLRASTTSPGVFDHSVDPSLDPSDNDGQISASVINAFYTVNWLHDWWYDSGFDEAAGNGQRDNYGRGGQDRDRLQIEVQDYSDRNNATMSTPSDGGSPKMEMYLWSGVADAWIEVDTGWNSGANVGDFGPNTFDLTAPLSEPSNIEACSNISGSLNGTIAIIERGNCTFESKVLRAENRGAVGVIIVNNVSGAAPFMSGDGSGANIPVLSVTDTDGARLRADLAAGSPEARMVRQGNAVDRDAGLDNTVISHEWGHYLFGRLINGCGSNECGGMNEGHSDWVALHTLLRDGDALGGTYGMAGWVTASDSADLAYFGLRRIPYSADFAYNALTFRHIGDNAALPSTHPVDDNGVENSEVHNSGEIWATVMFDAYLALQADAPAAGRTFDETRRRMSDIVVAGMILAPTDPGMLDLRDALIAAAGATNSNDGLVLATAFAGRGMGSCASGPTNDNTLDGVVEDFAVAPLATVSTPTLSDDLVTCDSDGLVDVDEMGNVMVTVGNAGIADLVGATVTIDVNPPVPGLSFPSGNVVNLSDLAPFDTVDVVVPIALDGTAGPTTETQVTATVNWTGQCVDVDASTWIWTDADTDLAFTDTFELDDGSWMLSGAQADEIWSWQRVGNGDYRVIGIDWGSPSDTALVSPLMTVSSGVDFVLTLVHRYDFEADQNTWWDGGVIEISVDGGNWEDIENYNVNAGYDGVITNQAGNVLAGRDAYSGRSGGWPNTRTLTLDLRRQLAGSTVEVRFRIGTDQAAGDTGWELAEFGASGIDAPVFPNLTGDVCDTSGCAKDTWYVDSDGDGFGDPTLPVIDCVGNQPSGTATLGTDCDDGDSSVSPAAAEVCGGTDEDCDGLVDDADPSVDAASQGTWYVDADGDGYGGSSVSACVQPPDTAALDGDCADGDGAVNPGANEICNGLDDDCNGLVDAADPGFDASSVATWYADADNDGFGDVLTSQDSCTPPAGHVSNSLDCDDSDGDVNPNGQETCGGFDEDCDGLVDDLDPTVQGTSTWHADGDGDGFGDASASVEACVQPASHVDNDQDCNDNDNTVNPDGQEVCGGGDEDCDLLLDDADDSVDASTYDTWYVDVDGDGYGTTAVQACARPVGTSSLDGDCNDGNAQTYPGAPEQCDSEDNDCDGTADEGVSFSNWYPDADGDGFGDATQGQTACAQPAGHLLQGGDCDDGNAAVNPAATEVCNTLDDDCDTLVDDFDSDVQGTTTWHADVDADGFGDPGDSLDACVAPAGWLVDATDCDPSNPAVNPAADEICNLVDDDCDTLVDQADSDFDSTTQGTWYADVDADGFGDPNNTVTACAQPSNTVDDATDCDDADATVNPAATEVCSGADEDCDGLVDDNDPSVDLSTGGSWFVDTDGDGLGGSAVAACAQPAGSVTNDADCNDADATVLSAPDWYTDADGDGYGIAVAATACVQPSGTAAAEGDCDDTASNVNPGATEVCGGGDEDCDGLTDDSDPSVDTSTATTFFADLDGDGFGNAAATVTQCAQPSTMVTDDTDCDDTAAGVNPAATEVCSGQDDDCDGDIDDADASIDSRSQQTWHVDGDDDGFGDPRAVVTSCNQPGGTVDDDTDCDDDDPDVYPGAPERLDDAIDNDCDGIAQLPDDEDVVDEDTPKLQAGGGGCACDAAPSGVGGWAFALALLAGRRRAAKP